MAQAPKRFQSLTAEAAVKALSTGSRRFLLADEVGLGKTVVAREVIAGLSRSGAWGDPIVTEVTPFSGFVPAETDHQGYYRRNGEQPYCRAVIAPKMAPTSTTA